MLVLTLWAGAAIAAPRVEPIAEPANGQPGCGFRTAGEPPAGGRLVLFWSGERGAMNVDGKTVALKVTESHARRIALRRGSLALRCFACAAATAFKPP
jgi:hypothetical protein